MKGFSVFNIMADYRPIYVYSNGLKGWLKKNTPTDSVFERIDSFGEHAEFRHLKGRGCPPYPDGGDFFSIRLPEKVCCILLGERQGRREILLDCFASEAEYIMKGDGLEFTK